SPVQTLQRKASLTSGDLTYAEAVVRPRAHQGQGLLANSPTNAPSSPVSVPLATHAASVDATMTPLPSLPDAAAPAVTTPQGLPQSTAQSSRHVARLPNVVASVPNKTQKAQHALRDAPTATFMSVQRGKVQHVSHPAMQVPLPQTASVVHVNASHHALPTDESSVLSSPSSKGELVELYYYPEPIHPLEHPRPAPAIPVSSSSHNNHVDTGAGVGTGNAVTNGWSSDETLVQPSTSTRPRHWESHHPSAHQRQPENIYGPGPSHHGATLRPPPATTTTRAQDDAYSAFAMRTGFRHHTLPSDSSSGPSRSPSLLRRQGQRPIIYGNDTFPSSRGLAIKSKQPKCLHPGLKPRMRIVYEYKNEQQGEKDFNEDEDDEDEQDDDEDSNPEMWPEFAFTSKHTKSTTKKSKSTKAKGMLSYIAGLFIKDMAKAKSKRKTNVKGKGKKRRPETPYPFHAIAEHESDDDTESEKDYHLLEIECASTNMSASSPDRTPPSLGSRFSFLSLFGKSSVRYKKTKSKKSKSKSKTKSSSSPASGTTDSKRTLGSHSAKAGRREGPVTEPSSSGNASGRNGSSVTGTHTADPCQPETAPGTSQSRRDAMRFTQSDVDAIATYTAQWYEPTPIPLQDPGVTARLSAVSDILEAQVEEYHRQKLDHQQQQSWVHQQELQLQYHQEQQYYQEQLQLQQLQSHEQQQPYYQEQIQYQQPQYQQQYYYDQGRHLNHEHHYQEQHHGQVQNYGQQEQYYYDHGQQQSCDQDHEHQQQLLLQHQQQQQFEQQQRLQQQELEQRELQLHYEQMRLNQARRANQFKPEQYGWQQSRFTNSEPIGNFYEQLVDSPTLRPMLPSCLTPPLRKADSPIFQLPFTYRITSPTASPPLSAREDNVQDAEHSVANSDFVTGSEEAVMDMESGVAPVSQKPNDAFLTIPPFLSSKKNKGKGVCRSYSRDSPNVCLAASSIPEYSSDNKDVVCGTSMVDPQDPAGLGSSRSSQQKFQEAEGETRRVFKSGSRAFATIQEEVVSHHDSSVETSDTESDVETAKDLKAATERMWQMMVDEEMELYSDTAVAEGEDADEEDEPPRDMTLRIGANMDNLMSALARRYGVNAVLEAIASLDPEVVARYQGVHLVAAIAQWLKEHNVKPLN
ncbi:hypothetical protein BGZ94_003818, partial [Podila epigama]